MKLKLAAVETVAPTAPFNFDATFHKPDHFTSGDNLWEPGVKWQTWRQEGKAYGLKIINRGGTELPEIRVEIYSDAPLSKVERGNIVREIKYSYNLDLDLKKFYTELGGDEMLGPVISRWLGMRPGHPSSLYEYLIIGIVLQNASVRRSVQMFKALLERYGMKMEFDGKELWCFWEPGSLAPVSEEELRALKVGYRAKSIKRIDDYFLNGQMDETDLRNRDREAQMKELLKLYGVGPATVWYLLFDVFHHWDFFDHISPWEQKIYSKLFFDRDPENPVPVEKLLKHFERFGAFKQLAVHYLWEDLWWKRKNESIPWMEKLIRI